MMDVLALALYSEGSTDNNFLPTIIQRTCEIVLAFHGQKEVDVMEPIPISKKRGSLEECILKASQETKGYDVLCIHNDADKLTYNDAKNQRFMPGYQLVQQYASETCNHLVPIIPVRMTEAWMLADTNTLRNVLGTDLDARRLFLPSRAALVEGISDPKNTLSNTVRQINLQWSRRRRSISLSTRYTPLARQIDLNKLLEVPSYREFVRELAQMLEALRFLQHGSASEISSQNYFFRW